MKKILFSFLIIIITIHSALAQDTLKKVCDYSLFPVGALRYTPGDTLQSMLGMNFNWYAWASAGFPLPTSFPMQTSFNDTAFSTTDPFAYHTPSKTVTDHAKLLTAAANGSDIRIFMPGTDPSIQEYNYRWNTKYGSIDSGHARYAEWRIGGDTLPVGYVLSDLTGILNQIPSAAADPYSIDDSSHIGPFSYDFVYFFNASDLAALSSDATQLYSIEYWIKPPGSSSFTFYKADTITRGSYNLLPIANTQVGLRNVGAEKLYTWTGLSIGIQYRLQKDILRIDTFYTYTNGLINTPQVDVRLRNFRQIPIYFRCLRIRNYVARQLLSGAADATLSTAITTLKNNKSNGSIKAWTIGNEPPYENFHCFAYLHELFADNGAPPLSVLAPSNHDMFIRIERDQSENLPQNPKMFLWHEWVPYSGTFWRSYSPFASPAYWDFGKFPKRPLPFTFSSSDSAEWYAKAVFFESNYSTYTNQWQNTILGFPSEAVGGGSGEVNALFSIAQSCYQLDPLHPIPYWGCYQAGASPIHNVPLWSVDSEVQANHYSEHIADSIYGARIVDPYINRHPNQILVEDSLYDHFYTWRASTAAEIRFQLWEGIAHGLKGYNANMAFDDMGNNDGILWDSGAGKIVKSTDRVEMRFDNSSDGSKKIIQPYSPSNAHTYYRNDTTYKQKSKLLPAFTGMYNGVKNTITNDLGPVIPTLAVLNWKGAVSWHKKDSTPTSLGKLPLKNVHAKTLTGTTDADTATYVDFGIHKYPTDSTAIYVSALNRRLWTDPLDTLTTDYRTITFQVDSTKFDPKYANFLWRISDVAGLLPDTTITSQQTYSFTVKPGQGKLFRIAPAIGLTVGRMSTNLFNNARHIAPLEYNQDSVMGYVATYQKNGKIYVSYPKELSGGAQKRAKGTPGDSLIESPAAGNILETPAVGYDSASGTVGIVYTSIHSLGGSYPDTARIYFIAARYSLTDTTKKYFFGAPTPLTGAFPVPVGYTPAPSIMPANDTVDAYKKSEPSPSEPQAGSPIEHVRVHVAPNPFHSSTQISIDVPKDVYLSIVLFDVLGRQVTDLFGNFADKDHYDFTLTNGQIAAGNYFLRVQSGSEVLTRKIQLVK